MERSGSFRNQEVDDVEHLTGANHNESLVRKRSLVRPERQRVDPDHPQFHYQQVAAQQSSVLVHPSSTGNEPFIGPAGAHGLPGVPEEYDDEMRRNPSFVRDNSTRSFRRERSQKRINQGEPALAAGGGGGNGPPGPIDPDPNAVPGIVPLNDEETADTGADDAYDFSEPASKPFMPKEKGISLWATYCRILTLPIIPAMMRPFGMKTPERQMAWREKIGLISVILLVGAAVGYLTFGFTESVCNNKQVRIHIGDVPSNNMVVSGTVYNVGSYVHPAVEGFNEGVILYNRINIGGLDASFMFQNVNGNCQGLITPKDGTSIPHDGDNMGWYFPCQLINHNGTLVNSSDMVLDGTSFYSGWGCHTQTASRQALYNSHNNSAIVYFTWQDLKNTTDQLVVFNGDVLNLNYLEYLLTDDLSYPSEFDTLRNDEALRGQDLSQHMSHGTDRKIMQCLREITKVGEIDTEPIGCIASSVVLYVSLVFIVGLVVIKFALACYFRFVIARRQGAYEVTDREYRERDNNIEDWTNDIYQQADLPASPMPGANKRRSMFMEKLTQPKEVVHQARNTKRVTMSMQNPSVATSRVVPGGSIYNQPVYRQSMYSRPPTVMGDNNSPLMADTAYRGAEPEEITLNDLPPRHPYESSVGGSYAGSGSIPGSPDPTDSQMLGPIGGNEEYLVPQPPVGYEPFGYPLAHTMCLVTAYSESVEGLRTTLDSVATTDYPNSHKLIVIICDGLIKGSGNSMSTPEICLSMMKDFSEAPDQVQPYSYVSVVSGSKRHNMAKVYAGFYKYDDSTVGPEFQQRVPVVCIVKCGTPDEAHAAKPGNRGKRDSQIILMSFLQRIMFDERMTELEFEIFNGIRSVTGIAPDFYETMLMVDADTKVYPDSLTHMVAEMVRDPSIMGLCGETKIANKSQTWVTMIQVFEYFISHHQAKAFESVFGGVTCLPGCFSMYRIKTPKGGEGYWLPILCNPDIVERYADNVIDTLHKKNLLLLGEDRYLSTLMLRTFPKRKMIFVPKAACKTVVPDEFKVLLSQRRRWINSTIHNLMELVLVRDLCGVFIISMQFVVFIDLVSTLVLPAAISFTIYIIVISIVKKPTPIISLVLLALILGLPGVLIVVTATRATYVLWMGVYLLALPIWNFILPMYAYWKFDDFSWGETRTIEGGDKGGHEDVAGEFDSSRIEMKRWRDFQSDRAHQAFAPSQTSLVH